MKLCFNLDGNGCKEVKVDDKCTVDENNECKGDSCKFDENNVKWYYQKKRWELLVEIQSKYSFDDILYALNK